MYTSIKMKGTYILINYEQKIKMATLFELNIKAYKITNKKTDYCKSINFRGVLFFAVFYGNKNPRKLVPRK